MEFAHEYPAEWRVWKDASNTLVILAQPNERKLWEFAQKLKAQGIKVSEFREPDIGNELTAIAIEPGPDVKRLCSGLPTAGKKTNPGAEERLRLKFDTVSAMEDCLQTSGQNMVQHGESVRDYLFDLIRFLREPHYTTRFQWRFPQWALSNAQRLAASLPDDYTIEKYALWHDCGKPTCRMIDGHGKPHYPNHAKVSADLFRTLYPGEEGIARLIEMDMDIHLLKGAEDEEFAKRPEAALLLLSGLAEIHSNAAMFGGMSSDSFKIKWKRLDRRGAGICSELFR